MRTLSRSDADQFNDELDRLVAKGAAYARGVSALIQEAAMKAFTEGRRTFDASRVIVPRIVPTLSDAMLVAYLRGFKRERETLRLKRGLALSVYDEVIKVLKRQLDVKDTRVIERQFGATALRAVTDVSIKVETEVRKTLNDLVTRGAHVNEAVKTLRETFDRVGLTRASDFRLEAVFRTQAAIAYGAGRWQADQDPVIQEILWGYEYVTAGDDRVRPEHEAMDGTRLEKDDPFWLTCWPPNGWNCRCQTIPIFDDEELATPNEPDAMSDGSQPTSDDGFGFNPGVVFSQALSA